MNSNPEKKPWKKRWKRWAWWAFILVNVGGIFFILPMIKSVGPLVQIWWSTRSQDSFRNYQKTHTNQAPSSITVTNPLELLEFTNNADAPESFKVLTNQVKLVENLSDKEISQIIAWKFGSKKKSSGDPKVFDRDSAVFHSIDRFTVDIGGRMFYCYKIDFVDQNTNHHFAIDCFTEPNLDYERGKATMDLVNRNPQLKRIYDAMSHILAQQSTEVEKNSTNSDVPVMRFEEGPSKSDQP